MSFARGLHIGKYEIGKKLGQGGFGILYTATDTELGREIAIKFLKPEHVVKRQVVQRFLQEARAAARIRHPGIVTVYESGEVSGTNTRADGTVYIAMELLAGDTLHNRLKRGGRMPYGMAIGFCRQLATALSAAHQAGIVHRDLKPPNIFIVPDPAVVGGERLKILDFGIAKLVDDTESSVNTQSMLMLGTPMYMSPEQCRSSSRVDARSDIYALGCILFELLCGRPPFDGDSGELIAKHQLVPPPTPRSVNPQLPSVLDHILTAMLAKNPDERPQTMSGVLDLLEECGDEGAIEPPTVPDHASLLDTPLPGADTKARRRSRIVVALGAVAAIGVGIGLGMLTMCGDRHDTARSKVAAHAGSSSAVPDEAEIERRKNACLVAQMEKRWMDLATCAKQLAPRDPASASAFEQTARSEAENEQSYSRLEHALDAKNLEAAKTALDEIEDSSAYRYPADSLFRLASEPTAAPAPASSPVNCDADALKEKAMENVNMGQHAAALSMVEASLRCKRDPYVLQLAFMEACASSNAAKAKLYFKQITPEQQSKFAQMCIRTNTTFQ